jgi:type III secretion system needle length determinant
MTDLEIQNSRTMSAETQNMTEDTCSVQPDRADAERFLKALEGDEQRHDSESGKSFSSKEDLTALHQQEGDSSPLSLQGTEQSLRNMSNPLDGLFSMKTAHPETPHSVDRSQLEQLVDRILVSSPEQGGHEIRLSLNSTVLKDTEVILTRNLDGRLSVTLQTPDTSSFQTLVSARGELQSLLEEQEDSPVQVTVDQDSSDEYNDTRRRSRGYQEQEF